MTPECNRCDGETELLGVLGCGEWFRCRRCDAEMYREIPLDPDPPAAYHTPVPDTPNRGDDDA